eukprot:scaffold25466_cov34-Tisochrysis_lutea.AAC.3
MAAAGKTSVTNIRWAMGIRPKTLPAARPAAVRSRIETGTQDCRTAIRTSCHKLMAGPTQSRHQGSLGAAGPRSHHGLAAFPPIAPSPHPHSVREEWC